MHVAGDKVKNYLMEEYHDCYQDYSGLLHAADDICKILDGIPEVSGDAIPEEGSSTPAKLKETLSSYWARDNTEVFPPRMCDAWLPSEAGMYIDMELSSP